MGVKDFKFSRQNEDGSVNLEAPIIVSGATGKDHSDVHYLYKMRKAIALLVGSENMSGYSEQQLKDIHEAIVKDRLDNGGSHWYDDYDSDLDDSLPDDLKSASDGYYPPIDKSVFNLDEHYESNYVVMLDEANALEVWSAPTKRKEVPSGHFLDQKNKKYPYKNKDGSVNCKGLQTALGYAKGARGAPKRAGIAAKAKRLIAKHCGRKKATEPISIGTLTKVSEAD